MEIKESVRKPRVSGQVYLGFWPVSKEKGIKNKRGGGVSLAVLSLFPSLSTKKLPGREQKHTDFPSLD